MTTVFIQRYKTNLIPLSQKKLIYYREDNTEIFVKGFTDMEAMERERILQLRASSVVPCPKILDCFEENGVGYLAMERIQGHSVYEQYGSEHIPSKVWKQIHSIVYKMYHINIHYIDITPYNFMIDAETAQVYVIDFGHAYECKVNWFLKHFLDGENCWNSDFE